MRQDEILSILRQAGADWVKRSELARQLKRRQLTGLDLQALAVLEVTGKIEVERRPDLRPAGHVDFYRLKEAAN